MFQPCYRQTLFTRFVSLRPRDPVTHLQGYGHNSTEWAQSIYPSHGRTNPAIDQSHQPNPFKYPRHTFMIAHLRSRRLMYSKHPSGGSDLRKDLTVQGKTTAFHNYCNVKPFVN